MTQLLYPASPLSPGHKAVQALKSKTRQACSPARLLNTLRKPRESPGSPIGRLKGKRTHVHRRISLPWKTSHLHFSPVCQKFLSRLPTWQVRTFPSLTLLKVLSSKAWALCSHNVLGFIPTLPLHLQAQISRPHSVTSVSCRQAFHQMILVEILNELPFFFPAGLLRDTRIKRKKNKHSGMRTGKDRRPVFSLTNTLLPHTVDVYPTFTSVFAIKYRDWKQLSRRKCLWGLYFPVLVQRSQGKNSSS